MRDTHAELLGVLRQFPLLRTSGIPLYLQAATALERWLHTRDLAAGHPLPPETELAGALGVSRPTLRQAVRHLAERGVVHTQRGVGTFVSPQVLTRPLQMTSLYEDLLSRGRAPTTQVLTRSVVPADDLTVSELALQPGEPVMLLERLRRSDDVPVALITNVLHLPPGADLTAAELEADGLYRLLERRFGLRLVSGVQRITVRLATTREATLLEVPTPAALLVARRVSFDETARGIEVSTTLYTEAAEITAPLHNR